MARDVLVVAGLDVYRACWCLSRFIVCQERLIGNVDVISHVILALQGEDRTLCGAGAGAVYVYVRDRGGGVQRNLDVFQPAACWPVQRESSACKCYRHPESTPLFECKGYGRVHQYS